MDSYGWDKEDENMPKPLERMKFFEWYKLQILSKLWNKENLRKKSKPHVKKCIEKKIILALDKTENTDDAQSLKNNIT